MNIQTQLLPHKHIKFSESLIGLAGFVRQILKQQSCTVDEVWEFLNTEDSGWLCKPSFDQVVIAFVILFSLNQVKELDNQKFCVVT